MTANEVNKILQAVKHMISTEECTDEVEEALDLAIKTVETEGKRADALVQAMAYISALEEEKSQLSHVQLLPDGTLIVPTHLLSQAKRVRVEHEKRCKMFYSEEKNDKRRSD